jgi:P27 family predicted phage terminase small subunit
MTRAKPTALKKLEGNRGKRPLNENEPKYPTLTDFEAPEWLTGLAREEWDRITPYLSVNGLLTVADIMSLSGYCAAVEMLIKAKQDIDKNGVVIQGQRGRVKNPAVAAQTEALSAVRQYSAMFGFDPSSRSKIIAAPKTDKGHTVDDFMSEFEADNDEGMAS